MTVPQNSRRRTHVGDGATVRFNAPMVYQTGDLRIYITASGSTTEWPQSLTTVERLGRESGAVATLTTPPPAGSTVTLLRTVPFEQPTDITNQGAFLPETLEKGLDLLAMQIQQVDDGLERAVKLPEVGAEGVDPTLPYPDPGKLLGWDADGKRLRNTDPSGPGDLLLRSDLADPAAAGGASLVRLNENLTVRQRLLEKPSITDRGVKAGGAAVANTAALQATIDAAGRGDPVYVPPGRYAITAPPNNSKGVDFDGPGKIVAPWPVSQINTYRNKRPVSIGREYLWRVYQVMENTNREIRCYTYGDSTVAGGLNYIDWPFFLQELLPSMAQSYGVINKFSVINRGVGGSNLSTWTPLPDVGVNSGSPADLIILKCGINDAFGASRLSLFESRLRDGLAAIRATSGGDIGSLAILLVGPNAVWDMEFDNRNTEWFESLRSIFEAASRDFKCAYFDAYSYLQDASFAAGRWLDTAANLSGTGLHPTNIGQSWIWGGVMDFIFGGAQMERYRTNKVHNLSNYRGWPSAKNPPTFYAANYPPGITMQVALVDDGFPITGYLHTEKQADGGIYQRLTPVDGSGGVMTRIGTSSSGFGGWRGTRGVITFSNGWSNFGGVFRTASVMNTAEGVIHLAGLIKPGTLTANTVICNLPSGYRPVNQHILIAATDAGTAVLEILGSGDVLYKSGTGTPTYLSLSGLSFIP